MTITMKDGTTLPCKTATLEQGKVLVELNPEDILSYNVTAEAVGTPNDRINAMIGTTLSDSDYKELFRTVTEMLAQGDVAAPDGFIQAVIVRVATDADKDWNDDDLEIAIKGEINDMICKAYNC